ncbi:hypothetical protein [Poritiphilus flavus]|uniref:Uncharacterized protein n=1 Tax=Poritiphilus flavus TaxID=2697053 RepID=A0A6L9EJT6_9FLAO|nr:hypothetical protein [Poritiphilus flavus]NAS14469.1 hypothetical protein [Poritiphilus flavus]
MVKKEFSKTVIAPGSDIRGYKVIAKSCAWSEYRMDKRTLSRSCSMAVLLRITFQRFPEYCIRLNPMKQLITILFLGLSLTTKGQSVPYVNVGVFEMSDHFEGTSIAYNIGLRTTIRDPWAISAQIGQERFDEGISTNTCLMATYKSQYGSYFLLTHAGARYHFQEGAINPLIGFTNMFGISRSTALSLDVFLVTYGDLSAVNSTIQAVIGVSFKMPRLRRYRPIRL